MRILITTQAVDKEDPLLGFFHGWIEAFSREFDHVSVICLREGVHELPNNVTIYSLGKEKYQNRFFYVWNFYRHLMRLHGSYDAVFSHMNSHYIILAGLYFKLTRKRILFWRNHPKKNFRTYVASKLSNRVFYTSPASYTARFENARQMPVGIDTHRFTRQKDVARLDKSILMLGRIAPVKRVDILVRACEQLPQFSAFVYGDASREDARYKDELKKSAPANVTFCPSVSNYEITSLYNHTEYFVNISDEGSMDKTVLEAAACETLILTSNSAFRPYIPKVLYVTDRTEEGLVRGMERMDACSEEEKNEMRKKLREMVVRDHSLTTLISLVKAECLS